MISSDHLVYLAHRRLGRFDISSKPQFGSKTAADWFLATIRECQRYLEFGAGGSTYTAAQHGVELVAVDADPLILGAVRQRIAADGLLDPAAQCYHHADIGPISKWGRPRHPWFAGPERVEQFRRYSDPPTACLNSDKAPDFVFVDGQFRTACALKALCIVQDAPEWTLAINNYPGRRAYAAIAPFANIDDVIDGRVAVVRSVKDHDPEELDERIRYYETVLD